MKPTPVAGSLRVAASPSRGQHQRPGKAGSAVFLAFGCARFMRRGHATAWEDTEMIARTEKIQLQGAAGVIEALRDRAAEGAPALGVAVIAHPHPLFGGSMDN